jgi:hypothetical protein
MVLPAQSKSQTPLTSSIYQTVSSLAKKTSILIFFSYKLYQVIRVLTVIHKYTTYRRDYRHIILHSLLFTLLLTILSPNHSQADQLTSPSVRIEMSTINITGGEKSSSSYKVTDTVGQTIQGQFDSSGFIIKAGFQYIYPLIPFSFRISNLDMDFGTIIPNTPSTLAHTLTVTTGSAYGYSVQTIADTPLKLLSGSITIPNTTCNLALTCTVSDATPWTDTTAYGFGYNATGDDIDSADFVDTTYFRPFPIEGSDNPAIVMSRSGVATGSASIITYKINIAGDQAAGIYQNNIQYIAVPSF